MECHIRVRSLLNEFFFETEIGAEFLHSLRIMGSQVTGGDWRSHFPLRKTESESNPSFVGGSKKADSGWAGEISMEQKNQRNVQQIPGTWMSQEVSKWLVSGL